MKFEDFNVLDIGTKLDIKGVLYGNGEEAIIILLPNESSPKQVKVLEPDLEQWNKIIRQSDLLEVEIVDGDPNKKIILRKSTRQIDAKVSWEVFRRDHYTCVYCGEEHAPLTVDHVVLWEEGGPSIPENLLTSCKKCNHTRGNIQFEDWLQSDYYKKIHLDPAAHSLIPVWTDDRIKSALVRIPHIKANLMRINKRNR